MAERESRRRRQFTEEFKGDAVDLVRSTGRPIVQIAQELGIYDSTLGNWVRQDRIDRGQREGLTTDERARLGRLEAENARLGMERDLLKRTVAFWSKRHRRREPLPLCRCPEGRWVPSRRCLRRGRGVSLGFLCLGGQEHPGTVSGRAGRSRADRRDPQRPHRVGRHLRVAAGDRRAWPARPEGEPQAGGAPHGRPRPGRASSSPPAQPHQAGCGHAARAGSAGSAV